MVVLIKTVKFKSHANNKNEEKTRIHFYFFIYTLSTHCGNEIIVKGKKNRKGTKTR